MTGTREITILLVEDDPGHARLIEKNLRRANVGSDLMVTTEGQQALDYLFSEGEYAGAERPSPLLVLLDLNVPVVDGFGVLERMRADERTMRVLVIVLTTTDDEREMEQCYRLGCNIYVTKPVEYKQFCEAIQSVGLFLSFAMIPSSLSERNSAFHLRAMFEVQVTLRALSLARHRPGQGVFAQRSHSLTGCRPNNRQKWSVIAEQTFTPTAC